MKQKSKGRKKYAFFIIMFPDGEQVLVKSEKSWTGLIPYTKYLKEKFEESTFIIAISWWEAIKFILKGRVFDAGK
jgi:hypothetical protein